MTENTVTVLGLGAMGRALAETLVTGGRPVTVWNRTPGKATDLVAKGVREAATAAAAVEAGQLVIACLLDHPSVHDTLDPIAGALAGRTLVNLTTTTPAEARELAAWAGERGIGYVDGGMMATPPMIGQPGAFILYSGPSGPFEAHRSTLDLLAESRYVGADAGLAALYDLALLSTMYAMFAGFFHGAALVATEGVRADEFARMAGPWINAMTAALPYDADFIDKGDYATEVQSLDFNKLALDAIVRVSRDQGIGVDVLTPIQALIHRQVAAGHGRESFVRIYEGIRHP
ncbi:NAD(P)-binding domain-containing protein [Actinomycetes bacterium KLBMP 9797]